VVIQPVREGEKTNKQWEGMKWLGIAGAVLAVMS
jgi:hypothetical protein